MEYENKNFKSDHHEGKWFHVHHPKQSNQQSERNYKLIN